MNKNFNVGDRVKFNEDAPQEVRGKTGVVNKFLEVVRLTRARLEQGESVYNGVYLDVNMWEIQLDDSNELYPSPEGWLDRIA